MNVTIVHGEQQEGGCVIDERKATDQVDLMYIKTVCSECMHNNDINDIKHTMRMPVFEVTACENR